LGGLQWSQVHPRIEQAFAGLPDTQVLLFEPVGAPAARDMVVTAKPPRMTEGKAALLGLMERYLSALMDPFVSLLEIHKLMYLTQEAGERLRLRYTKAPYGPYASNLRHVLTQIEGHFTGYADAGDAPGKHIEMNPEAVQQALIFLQDHPITQQRFERVVDLVEGFETPFGLELLTTVHWVAVHDGATDLSSAIEKTHAWNVRKQMFDAHQIGAAWNALTAKNWLPATVEAQPQAT
jgi:O-acetyl-ADP-ribose deacetylase (regulator of RNase III)